LRLSTATSTRRTSGGDGGMATAPARSTAYDRGRPHRTAAQYQSQEAGSCR
jgi:hypothetical protein